MLAMLSCVLSGSPSEKCFGDTDDLRLRSQPQLTSSNRLGGRKDAPNCYFPSFEVTRNLLRPPLPRTSKLEKRLSGPQSTSSSIGATTSDPMTPYSTGATPPDLYRPPATSFERADPQLSTISTSSELHRNTYRSSSNLASTFAASFSRPFSFSASVSTSPPTANPGKRLSPAGSYIGAPPPSVTWGATSFFSKPSTISEDPKSAYSISVSDTEEDIAVPKAPVFTTKLKNQDQFCNEGYTNMSLLDPDQSRRYHAYRESYAHMLFVWDMPLARCEVLQYNSELQFISSFSPKSIPGFPSSLIAIGKSTAESPLSGEERGLRLGLRTHCTTLASEDIQRHGDQRCANGASSESPLTCILCAEIIRGLSSPCLACGHVLHIACRSIILSQVNTTTGDWECISGCGCRCASHSVMEVEAPLVHSVSPSPTVVGGISKEQEQHKWGEKLQNDDDTWEDIAREDVAYESLARVRERYITPKPSQIWRGAEDRRDAKLAAKREQLY